MTDDEIIEIVEDHVSMGHGAWDMVSNEDLVAGFRIALATPAPAQPDAHEEDSLEWKLSCVIDYATGGKLSKPGWALATIKAAIDEHVNALYEEWSEDRDDDEESEEPDPLHVANERGEGEARGIEKAARWVDRRRDEYEDEHGTVDPETGSMEFGRGPSGQAKQDYVETLWEIAEGIRALSAPKGEEPSHG